MRNTLLVSAIVALALAPALAQQKELSITTASPEALAMYQKALDYAKNVESGSARLLLDQALQKDADFAMAYDLRASTGRGFTVARQNREKALDLQDKVSPGERHWILAAQAQADGDVPRMKQHLAQLLTLHPDDSHVAYFCRQCDTPGGRHRGTRTLPARDDDRSDVRGALQSDRLHPSPQG